MTEPAPRIAREELIPDVLRIAREAGVAIMDVYRRDFSVAHKADSTPLTEADLAAHAIILAGLRALAPGVPVLSEEAEPPPYAERLTWGSHWLVDPLDGTRQFIRGSEQFTVNIALVEGHAPVLGVIHVPATGVSYFAARGAGSWRQAEAQAQPERVHARFREAGPLRVLASGCQPGKQLAAFLDRLGPWQVEAVGSSLKSCLIAEGKADLYARFGPTGEWDTAAAQILLEEAGGRLTDLHMRPLRYNTKPSLINPCFIASAEREVDWSRHLAP